MLRGIVFYTDVKINRNLEADCFCHLLFIRCPIVYFRWARGANARETTQERGEALLRRLSPLSLRFSLSRSPFPDSLLSIWFRIRFWFAEHRGARDQESGGLGGAGSFRFSESLLGVIIPANSDLQQ